MYSAGLLDLVCQILPNCRSSLASSISCFQAMQQELKTSSIMHNVDDSCTIFTNKYGYKTIGIHKISNINTYSHTESIPYYVNQSLTEFTHFKKSAYIYIYLNISYDLQFTHYITQHIYSSC